MKQKRKFKHLTIKADTPEEFDRKINEAFDEAEDVELKTHDTVPLLAYLKCTYYIEEPEDLADEYELRGIVHTCEECPHLDTSRRNNSRQKKLPCKYAKYGVTYTTSRACNRFYEELEKEE